VARELQALVLPRVEALIEGAVKDAVAALFEDPSKGLGDKVAAALQAAATIEAGKAMDDRAVDLLGPLLTPLLEPVVWKVVPELAEDMLREEIRRLTEEEDP
jgi:cell pole-organizing protein PopZ